MIWALILVSYAFDSFCRDIVDEWLDILGCLYVFAFFDLEVNLLGSPLELVKRFDPLIVDSAFCKLPDHGRWNTESFNLGAKHSLHSFSSIKLVVQSRRSVLQGFNLGRDRCELCLKAGETHTTKLDFLRIRCMIEI
ncbi:hypothetical protein AC579_4929 [Pseudocercospora musae]|uniref:Uncharacterized protein n=1 Tax=Pseudocercospora musae TaxID=113226 RepID=A0A139I241_9PEZI|nr:hypothetical protein AC579_4929 [Pseudocercospora musae]